MGLEKDWKTLVVPSMNLAGGKILRKVVGEIQNN